MLKEATNRSPGASHHADQSAENGSMNGASESKEEKNVEKVSDEEVRIENLESKLRQVLTDLSAEMWPSDARKPDAEPIHPHSIGSVFVPVSQIPSIALASVENRPDALLSEKQFESGCVAYSLWLKDGEPNGDIGWLVTHEHEGLQTTERVRLRLRTNEFWFGEQKKILGLPQNFRFRQGDYLGIFADFDRLAFSFTVNSIKLPELVFTNTYVPPQDKNEDSLWKSIKNRALGTSKAPSSTVSTPHPETSSTSTPTSTSSSGTSSSSSGTSSSSSSSSKSSSSSPQRQSSQIPPNSHLAFIGQQNRELFVSVGQKASWRALSLIGASKAELNGGTTPYFFQTHHQPLIDTEPLKVFERQAELILELLFIALSYMPSLSATEWEGLNLKSPSKVKVSLLNRRGAAGAVSSDLGSGVDPSTASSSSSSSSSYSSSSSASSSSATSHATTSSLSSPSKTLRAIYEGQATISAEHAKSLIDLLIYSEKVGLKAILGDPWNDDMAGRSSTKPYHHLMHTCVIPFLLRILRRNSERVAKTMIAHFLSVLRLDDVWTDELLKDIINHVTKAISLSPYELILRHPSLVVDWDKRGSVTELIMLLIRIVSEPRCFDLCYFPDLLLGQLFAMPAIDHRIRVEPFIQMDGWGANFLDNIHNGTSNNFSQEITDAVAGRHLQLGRILMTLARFKEPVKQEGASTKATNNTSSKTSSSAPTSSIAPHAAPSASHDSTSSSAANTSSSAPSASSSTVSASSSVNPASADSAAISAATSSSFNPAEANAEEDAEKEKPKRTKPLTTNNFLRQLRTTITQLPGVMRGQTAVSSNWSIENGLMFSLLSGIMMAPPEIRSACFDNVLFSNVLLDKTRVNVDRLGGTFQHVAQTWPDPLSYAATFTVPESSSFAESNPAALEFPDAESGWMFEFLDAAIYLFHHSYVPTYAHLMYLQNEFVATTQILSGIESAKRRRIRKTLESRGIDSARISEIELAATAPSSSNAASQFASSPELFVATGVLDMAITMAKLNQSHASISLYGLAYQMVSILPQFLLFQLSQWLSEIILHTMDNPSRSDLLHYFPESYVYVQINLAQILRFAHDSPLSVMAGWHDIGDDPQVFLPSQREKPEMVPATSDNPELEKLYYESPEKVIYAAIGRKRVTIGRRYNSWEEKLAAEQSRSPPRSKKLPKPSAAFSSASPQPSSSSAEAPTAIAVQSDSSREGMTESIAAPSETITSPSESIASPITIDADSMDDGASSSSRTTRGRADSDPVPPASHVVEPDPTTALAIDPASHLQEELDTKAGRRRLATSEPPANSARLDFELDEDEEEEAEHPRMWYYSALFSSLATLVNRGLLLNPNLAGQVLTILGKTLTASLNDELLLIGPKRFTEFLDMVFALFVDKRLMFWTVVLEALLVILVPTQHNSARYRTNTREYLTDNRNKKRLKEFLNKLFNMVNWCQNELDALIDSYLEKLKLITTNVDALVAAPSPPSSTSPPPSSLGTHSASAAESEGFSLDEALGFGAFANSSQSGGLNSGLTNSTQLPRTHSTTNLGQSMSAASSSSSAPQGFGPARANSSADFHPAGNADHPAPAVPAQPIPAANQPMRHAPSIEEQGFPKAEAQEGWKVVPTGHADRVQVEIPIERTARIALLRQLTPLKSGIDTVIREAPLYFEIINHLIFVLGYFTQSAPQIFEDPLIITRTCEIVGHTLSRALDSSGSPPLAKLCRLLDVAPKAGYQLPAQSGGIESLFDASAGPIIVSCTRIVCTLLTSNTTKDRAISQLAGLIPRRSIDTFLSMDFNHIDGWEEAAANAFTALKDADSRSQREMLLRSGQEECPICYSNPVNTTFIPCNHRSCNECIERHLLNNKQCFFCKADIVAIRRDGGDDLKISMN